MLVLMMLVGIGFLGVVIYLTSTNRIVPWVDRMVRVNAGVKHQAEWIAPEPVQAQVRADYLRFFAYARRSLPLGWIIYRRELVEYLTGSLLAEQEASIDVRLRHDRGRIIDILHAQHHVTVRHFSTDGLRCVVVDHQTHRQLATLDYWTRKPLHTQQLPDTVVVYEMRYESPHWKLAHCIQEMHPASYPPHSLQLDQRQTAGKDQ